MALSLGRDLSLSAVVAGFVAVLVGFSSSAVFVFEAARVLGANAAQSASWLWALGVGMALTSIVLSLRYRMPIITAWSTPAAALLITSSSGVHLAEAVGAFVVSGLLVCVAGFSGGFERIMRRVPMSLASAMLAGILLRFGMDVFVSMQQQFGLVFGMFMAYVLMRRLAPRYAVPMALLVGLLWAGLQGQLHLTAIHWQLTMPVWVTPQFSPAVLVGVALPMFVVTMASQNMASADFLVKMQTAAGQASNLLKVLSHPDRLLLMCQLSQGEYCVSELEQILGLGQPSLSQQLGVLRQEELVTTRRAGKQIYYQIASDDALAVLQVLYSRFCPIDE